MAKPFYYLATPYTNFPGGHDAAGIFAAKQAALCLEARILVHSPIAESHAVSRYVTTVSPDDHDFWLELDECIMAHACGLIVCMGPNWRSSIGIAREIGYFRGMGKPVVYMKPDSPPQGYELFNALAGK